ncbi:MAG: DUF4136 domain-containing protein [Betaproteobacteria bacterium]|nr:DUF4136 domain-containing protein [Betaproteobacteria bacterium]
MNQRIVRWLAPLALLLLGGCSTLNVFPAKVTAFSAWKPLTPMTYAFDRTPAQAKSLEDQTYEADVRQALATRGFVETADAPKYKVAIRYGVTDPRVTREYYVDGAFPSWWGGGYWGPYWNGFYTARQYEQPWYTRELRIDITEAATGQKLYEATARNDSMSRQLAPAIPYLARALVDEFPQGNGTTRSVNVPLGP